MAEGEIVETDGRIWRVGLVNSCRARLDPITDVLINNPVTGSVDRSYGSSINVSPQALVKRIDPAELDDKGQWRLGRLVTHAKEDKEKQMETQQVTEKGSNAARLAAFKAKQAAKKKAQAERQEKTVKNAKAGPKGKAEKALNDCKCGCGLKTLKNFVPGHDAVFKGKLLRVERGEMKKEDAFSKAIIGQYKWKKAAAGGEMPTTNYKGEPHTGYAKVTEEAPAKAKKAKAAK